MMPDLIITMFILNIVIYLVNEIGADTVATLLWHLYLKFPSSASQNAREQLKKKRETMELKREMNNTSSQDEFAKWAKLRRRHDKSLEEYESLNQVTSGEKASFDKKVRTVRWLSTNGLKIVLQFYYTKSPMFTLPGGWLPYPVEWILCFPKAPVGTVSIQVWNNLCAAAIALFAEILGGLAVQLVRKPAASSATKEAKKTQ